MTKFSLYSHIKHPTRFKLLKELNWLLYLISNIYYSFKNLSLIKLSNIIGSYNILNIEIEYPIFADYYATVGTVVDAYKGGR